MVYQLCLGFMKGRADLAQDLVQETFINTWKGLPAFKGDSSYKTWLYRITVNTCLKYIRDHSSKDQHAEHDEASTDKQVTEDEPSTFNHLYQAIGQLKELDRLIIMLVLDELKYAEISEIVGISEANVRVKVHRIKKNLKQIMQHG